MMGLLILRLAWLQLFQGSAFLGQSRDNQFLEKRIPSARGLVLDRQGQALALNVTACELSLSRRALESDSTLAPKICRILGWPEKRLEALYQGACEEGLSRIVLERDLDQERILRVEERLPDLPGLRLRDWARRTYPRGELAAHILGYVGEVSPEELETWRGSSRAYFPADLMGRSGVERRYQDRLRGQDGKELFLVNARGSLLQTVERLEPVEGETLRLSLDIGLCAVLDSALAEWGLGAGVVMDIESGDLLAAASRPAFDPNFLSGGMTAPEWNKLREDPSRPMFNRVLQAGYAPGSTFKPLVALAALEEKLLHRSSFEPCGGGLDLGTRYFRCWLSSGHGKVSMESSLERSCDVYYYQIGDAIGVDPIADMARRFGMGSRTGLDLGSEQAGLVPDSDYYNRRFGKGRWTRGYAWNLSIGQGEYLCTPLQMAIVYAGLARGDILPSPKLLLGESLPSSRRAKKLGIEEPHLRRIRKGLFRVMEGPLGTARESAVPGIPSAGKTGTVQNPHGLEHAWFCGYAPAKNPRIAIALIVEHGEHGTDIAPIFSRLVEYWLRERGEF
jgi:penicillin-binding protein 2